MKKVLLIVLAVILVSGLILSGCAEKAPAPTPAPVPSPAPAPAPNQYGGILKLNWQGAPMSFGVPLNTVAFNQEYSKFCLQGLLMIDDTKPGVYIPVLSTSWEMAPDRSAYTFNLRKGVMFHDGTPFNAQAVKWNLDKIVAAPAPFLKKIKSIDVVDEYTVRFNLSDWDALVLSDLADPICFIISPTAYEKEGEEYLNTHPVGTGPFIVKKYERSVSVVFEKNPNYWEKGLPYLDEIQFTHATDQMTQMAMLTKGDVHAILGVNVTTAGQMVGSGLNIDYVPMQHSTLYFNATDPSSIWSDKRMREALEYAVNKKKICETLGLGMVEPFYEVLYAINAIGNPGTSPRVFDQTKAKQLISEAGHADGVKVKLYCRDTFMSDLIMAMIDDLAQVGITIDLEILKQAAFIEKSRSAPAPNDLIWNPIKGNQASILGFAANMLASTGTTVPGMLRPQGFDDLLAQALNEPDPAKQLSLLEQMEKILYGEEVMVPYWSNPYFDISSPKVHFQWFWAGSPNFNYKDAWIEE